jgi:hypothetical protein
LRCWDSPDLCSGATAHNDVRSALERVVVVGAGNRQASSRINRDKIARIARLEAQLESDMLGHRLLVLPRELHGPFIGHCLRHPEQAGHAEQDHDAERGEVEVIHA